MLAGAVPGPQRVRLDAEGDGQLIVSGNETAAVGAPETVQTESVYNSG